MGIWDSFLSLLHLNKKRANIMIVGLDNAGKSSVVRYLQTGKSSQITVPTIGYQVETIKNGRLTLTAFDMSGQSKYRSMWERYYSQCHGVVFVIDSSDAMRMAVAANELQLMIQHPDMANNRSSTRRVSVSRQQGNDDDDATTTSCGVPILVLANKSDLDTAMPIGQIRAQLGLDDVTQHPLHLEASNALSGVGLHSGLQWLSDQVLLHLANNNSK